MLCNIGLQVTFRNQHYPTRQLLSRCGNKRLHGCNHSLSNDFNHGRPRHCHKLFNNQTAIIFRLQGLSYGNFFGFSSGRNIQHQRRVKFKSSIRLPRYSTYADSGFIINRGPTLIRIARYIPISGNGSKTTGQCGIGFASKFSSSVAHRKFFRRSNYAVRLRRLPLCGVANRNNFALLGSNALHFQFSIARLFHIKCAGFLLCSIKSHYFSRSGNILRHGIRKRNRRLIPMKQVRLAIFTTVLIGRYRSYFTRGFQNHIKYILRLSHKANSTVFDDKSGLGKNFNGVQVLYPLNRCQ